MKKSCSLVTACSCLYLFITPTIATATFFMGLSDTSSGSFSRANSVSADGTTVVGTNNALQQLQAFAWTENTGQVGLGFIPGGSLPSFANSISADGSVVVGASSSRFGQEAFVWSKADGMVGIGDFSGGGFSSEATSVSADGTVVVGTGTISTTPATALNRAFMWTKIGGLTNLGDLPGGENISDAKDISADGSIIVGQGSSALGREAYRWTATDGMIGLGDLPGGGFGSSALSISADGSTIVGQSSSGSLVGRQEAFRWTTNGGMVGLGDLPGGLFLSEALGVSGDGSIIVGNAESDLGGVAFIWDKNNGMRNLKDVLINDYNLDLTGWLLTDGFAISDDGSTIVGMGLNPQGKNEAWLANISTVPTPSAFWLFGSGLLGLIGISRRKK